MPKIWPQSSASWGIGHEYPGGGDTDAWQRLEAAVGVVDPLGGTLAGSQGSTSAVS